MVLEVGLGWSSCLRTVVIQRLKDGLTNILRLETGKVWNDVVSARVSANNYVLGLALLDS